MPKRKAGEGNPKYYAVRVGVSPGVYRSWPECQAQVTGFRGAIYKAFETEADARAFVSGRRPPSENSKKAKTSEPTKFYAVATGRKPGIYTDWDTANTQAIIGVKGPKYKKFSTRADAENFIRLHGSLETIMSLGLVASDDDEDDDDDDDDDDNEDDEGEEARETPVSTRKKIKVQVDKDVHVLRNPQGVNLPDAGFHNGVLHIYTDGSSKRNGAATARGGLGVFFGHNDPRNTGEPLEGMPQTNQRAELAAIKRALELAPLGQNVMIITDSTYSINCLSKWKDGWIKNGWKSSKGVAVLNQDLIKGVLAKIEERRKHGAKTDFEWVKGHAQSPGNIEADKLAVQGSRGW